ncbi:MAG: sugar dehydrogenase complex small subunit [Ramlibacter sp.]
MPLDRRTLLKALAATAAAIESAQPVAVALAAPPPTAGLAPAQFAALSAGLTGYPVEDKALSARMLAAFATPARRSGLKQLARVADAASPGNLDAAIRAAGLDAIANELVAAWYSGLVKTPQGEKVVTYTGAMMWTAMKYAKPMGVCGGPFGYWSGPPR